MSSPSQGPSSPTEMVIPQCSFAMLTTMLSSSIASSRGGNGRTSIDQAIAYVFHQRPSHHHPHRRYHHHLIQQRSHHVIARGEDRRRGGGQVSPSYYTLRNSSDSFSSEITSRVASIGVLSTIMKNQPQQQPIRYYNHTSFSSSSSSAIALPISFPLPHPDRRQEKGSIRRRKKRNDGRSSMALYRDMMLAQRRGFKLSPKYEDRVHKAVSMHELVDLLLTEKKAFGGALGAIIVASAAAMVVPSIFGNVVDILSAAVAAHPPSSLAEATAAVKQIGVMDSSVLDGLYQNALAMLGVSIVGTAATYISTATLDIVGQRISLALRKRLFNNIMEQDLEFFDVNKSGELANRLSTDVHEVAEHLVENVSNLLFASVMTAGSAGMLMYISPKLSLITLSVGPAVAIGAGVYSKIVKRLSRKLLNALASSTQVAAERFSAIRIVRHFAAEEREKQLYAQIIDESMGLAKQLAVSEGAYVASIYLVSNFALLGVLFLGAGMVVEDSITVGALASYCLYANHLSEAIKDSTDGVAGIIRAQGAAGRLYALLETRPKLIGGSLQPPRGSVKGLIQFKQVTFHYPTRPQSTVFKDFTLTLKPGENVGVTGASGCGKSSLALLLTRMYAPSQGVITLDGYDISTLDRDWLRRTVGVISQEALLFSGTVRENIAYGRPDATDEEIYEAAKLANADSFISQLPHGYETQIGERALVLSGGQKQRLSIARCMLLRPKVLILDESTTALDSANETEVLRKLLEVCQASTVLMVGHSARQLEGSNRLITLDKHGHIVKDEMLRWPLPDEQQDSR